MLMVSPEEAPRDGAPGDGPTTKEKNHDTPSAASGGRACGHPLARTGWAVIGHPELTVEATQDVDGNLVIRVI